MNDRICLIELSKQLHEHADRCEWAVGQASDRSEHIRATQIALEASRMALALDRYISQNTVPGEPKTDPVPVVLDVC